MYGFTTEFEPFAVGFLSCESENLSKKAASGLLRAAEKMNITVDPDLGLVYAFQGMNCTLTFGGGITCNEDGLERLREDYPESAADIRYIIDNMKGYATGPKVFDAFSQTELDLLHSGSLWGGTWTGHAVPEFAAIASHGTDFIRKKVTAYSMKNTGSAEFYEAINTAMERGRSLRGCLRTRRIPPAAHILKSCAIRSLTRRNRRVSTLPKPA